MTVEKFDIADPVRTRAILEKYRIRPKKSLGQNFLNAPVVIDQIVDSAQIGSTDIVLEIGPGIGALTQQLAKVAHKVFAFELDQNLLPVLQENLADYSNVQVINADFLQIDLRQFFTKNDLQTKSIKVVANLPYYVTTPILWHLLNAQVSLQRLVLMMQKEVAERLSAQPNHREYGALSVAVQTKTEVEITQIVPRSAFVPQPNVDSAVVSFDLTKKPDYGIQDTELFMKVVNAVFKQKRKNLWNNLINLVGKTTANKEQLQEIFDQLQWLHQVRAEQLSIADLVKLAKLLHATNLV
ncbi:16S rRNA (adenine(1518)-N(6)/adenine(1519)-N(6))-dimethyltransferase RsmA [Bombilactobacillus thymidiniphilus]|uniref:Ribosomal RNA small subunit methyltransferase A n=1 Tax=Bombilactobacillus thymidiniphilus TaxID=2923363 RepID=A0ABY4PE70_9LACO|nr:16S rRNA (adenine(1518)-N(6)/adenine(1519)-N(6))-dimethyltransferase RsmA [Bombilactobacillus thymidiniphilus]UQS84050.1 16S rRNA (adenine(1518)-N(6)/adenine(1519)-N(6))-dimethyltransferase RsmA [Bombilactobacillus thymidiniphilus]